LKLLYAGDALQAIGPAALIGGGALVALAGGMLFAAYEAGYFKDNLDSLGITVDDVKNKSIAQLAAEMNKLGNDYNTQVTSLQEYTSKTELAANGATLQAAALAATAKENDNFNTILAKSPALAQKFIDAATQAGISTSKWKAELADHSQKTRDANAAQQAYNELIDQGTAKVTAQNQALQQNIDMLSKAADAKIADSNAQYAQTDAVNSYYEAAVGAMGATKDTAAANETLGKALNAAESAILKAAEAHKKATGNAADYKAELEQVAGTLAPGSPLQVWLQQYIAGLHSTPSDVNTNMHLNENGVLGTLAQIRDQLNQIDGRVVTATVQIGSDITGGAAQLYAH
jgi:hypothetical protein